MRKQLTIIPYLKNMWKFDHNTIIAVEKKHKARCDINLLLIWLERVNRHLYAKVHTYGN